MTQHDHKHHAGGKQRHHSGGKKPALHKNWVTWVVVALMLGAMLMYVLSDDESIQPGAPAGEGLPADRAPIEAAP
jgi:hypothetical protein